MKKIQMLAVCCLFCLGTGCSIYEVVPRTVTVEGTVYQCGFYENLYPQVSITDTVYEVNGNLFYRVEGDAHDWLCCFDVGTVSEGTIYCEKSQWETAQAYYADAENYDYYCKVGTASIDYEPELYEISEIDKEKFLELTAFGEEHQYHPFGGNSKIEKQTLPMPEESESPRLVFYRESKDGCFASFQGCHFYAVDGQLLLTYQYQRDTEEWIAVPVPEPLSSYFVSLASNLKGKRKVG